MRQGRLGGEEARAQPKRLAERGDGLVVATLSLLHDAEVVVGPRLAGRQPHRLPEGRRRLAVPVAPLQVQGERLPEGRIVRPAPQGHAQGRRRLGGARP